MKRIRHALAAALLAASMTAAVAQQPVVVQGLDCRGDDSGWRLDANRASATWTAVSPKKRVVVFRGSLQTIASPAPQAIVWRGDSTHLPRETLIVTAHQEACKAADALAGTHRAVLSIRAGEAVTGCCVVRAGYDARVAPVANLGAKPASDWSRQIIDLLPAVNACASRDGARLKAVAGAAPAAQGAVKVRLIETDSKAIDCTVEASGRGTPALATVDAAAAPPGNPLYYLPRDPPPIVSCGRLERVQTTRGTLAGYLHYDPC